MKRRIDERRSPQLYIEGKTHTLYRKRKFRLKTILKIGAFVILALLIVLLLWGYTWLKAKEAKMHVRGVDSVLDSTASGQPVNTLILGVDRGSVKGEENVARSDIMMILSVNKKSGKSAVISIPRDTRVRIPGYSGYEKINAAYAFGETPLAIETVKNLTALSINHYVILDFEGFKSIVNALGGVPMHIDVAIHDRYAGDVPAGDVVLNGDQALAFVRARHDPRTVPAGDLDRVKNQRKFLQAMLGSAAHTRNPFKITKLVDAVSSNAKTDLSFFSMLSIGRDLQSSNGSVKMTTAPGEPRVLGGVWYYIIDEAEFKDMLKTFAERTEVEPEKSQVSQTKTRSRVRLVVLNGAAVTGLASKTAEQLSQLGYKDILTGNAVNLYSRTTVYYGEGKSEWAGLVASDLEGVDEPVLDENAEVALGHDADVVVVLGKDYRLHK
ncbi:MAG: LCP family protein [Actinomycetota bacterium]|nr:LCP family protein [Actinomycetota bacterium]